MLSIWITSRVKFSQPFFEPEKLQKASAVVAGILPTSDIRGLALSGAAPLIHQLIAQRYLVCHEFLQMLLMSFICVSQTRILLQNDNLLIFLVGQ